MTKNEMTVGEERSQPNDGSTPARAILSSQPSSYDYYKGGPVHIQFQFRNPHQDAFPSFEAFAQWCDNQIMDR
jgi:hypothetical protein